MFAQVLKSLRLKSKMNQSDLAEILGVERSTISRWESGASTPPVSMVEKLSALFGVSLDMLMGKKTDEEYVRIPVRGRVQAGLPAEATEDIISYEYIPKDISGSEYFALQIRGDSMSPRMMEGDVIIVRRQQDVNSGDIAVVMVGNEDATVKKIAKHEDGITLIAYNPSYAPRFITNREIMNLPVTILGKVVELRARF